MKKTIQINIAGIVFNIEEDAYATLSDYLASVQKYFAPYEGSEEIVADIEARIAEKFIGKNKPDSVPVITSENVSDIMKSMGSVADFEAIEEEAAFTAETQTEAETETTEESSAPKEKKKIFRDTKRKALGGVLAGLANYFNTDVVWFRVLFLIGFLGLAESGISGFLFIAYIICWIAFPANEELEEDENIKKFYRNPEGKVIGGVATGLASYLNMDVALLRIIFVVLIPFFGIGLLAYAIMWIASPKAQTLTQRMEMKGEAVTIENIDSNIKQNLNAEKAPRVKREEGTLSKILLFPFRILGLAFSALGRGLSHLGPVVRILIGILLVMLGLSLTIGAISSTAVFYGLLTDHSWFVTDLNLGGITQDLPANAGIFLFLATAIPAVATLLSGIILITNDRIGTKNFWLTGLGLWVVGVFGLSFIGGKYSLNFAKRSSIKDSEVFSYAGETIYLDSYENMDDDTHDYGLRILLEPSKNNNITIIKEFTSSGPTNAKAKENASLLNYQVNVRDSLFVFNERPVLDAKSSFRNQRVRVKMEIPEGKKIKISEDFARHLLANDWSVRSRYGIDYKDFDKLIFMVNEDGELICTDCEPLDEKEQEAYRERESSWSRYYLDDDDFKPRGSYDQTYDVEDFEHIEINSIFRALITQGNEFSVSAVAESSKDLEDLKVEVRNGTLNFEFRDRFFENRDRVNLYITLPSLEGLEASGASKVKVIDFDNIDRLKLNISGASNAQLDIDAREVDYDGSGASKAEIKGSIGELKADVSGASKLDAEDAEIRTADVEASGASKITLGEVESLRSNTSGASSIKRR
ncbi:PspC domain-containing protein [Jiulongibacter sp. NS-SX5]|uniref:PspC domain-containing protein n=1 Tax=Jiulongibacter sp. NS-SX5 TaxID=3463854 RepID=UPI004058E1B9